MSTGETYEEKNYLDNFGNNADITYGSFTCSMY